MVKDFKVLAFISGRGSNLKSLLDNSRNYKIIGIVSDNPDAPGLQYGETYGVPVHIFSRKNYSNRVEFKRAIFDFAGGKGADLFALAGFMQIVSSDFIELQVGKIINVHPSLLPKYPGLDTHRQVLAAKEKEHGCTVHFVDAGVDTGPIIAQMKLECRAGETEEQLSARVLELEHQLYPWVVNSIAQGRIVLKDNCVVYAADILNQANQRGILIPRC